MTDEAREERGSAELRARIHLAALRRFAAEGYEGATLRSIALDAGLGSAAHLYYYAPRKIDLLVDAVVAHASLPADLRSALPEGPPADVLRDFMVRYLEAFDDEGRQLAFVVLQQEALRIAEAGRAALSQNLAGTIVHLQQWFAEQVDAGAVTAASPSVAARAVLGFCNLHIGLRATGSLPVGADDEAIDAIVELLWTGIAPTA